MREGIGDWVMAVVNCLVVGMAEALVVVVAVAGSLPPFNLVEVLRL